MLRPVKRSAVGARAGAVAALLRLLRPFYGSFSVVIDGARWRIPLIKGVGLENRLAHELWMTDLLRRLIAFTGSKGLIDVGVNVGQTLLKLKNIDRALSYYGFEPNPFCVLYAQELVRLNRLSDCELYPAALSDGPALFTFVAEGEADSGGSILVDLRPDKRSFMRQHVAALVFDDLELEDAMACTLVKIDVEGAELQVLRGMRKFLRTARPVVICEVLHAHSEATLGDLAARNRNLRELLRDAQYAILRIRKGPGRVEGVDRVDAFPDRVWSAQSIELCDFVLAPDELADDLVRALSNPDATADVSAARAGPGGPAVGAGSM